MMPNRFKLILNHDTDEVIEINDLTRTALLDRIFDLTRLLNSTGQKVKIIIEAERKI